MRMETTFETSVNNINKTNPFDQIDIFNIVRSSGSSSDFPYLICSLVYFEKPFVTLLPWQIFPLRIIVGKETGKVTTFIIDILFYISLILRMEIDYFVVEKDVVHDDFQYDVLPYPANHPHTHHLKCYFDDDDHGQNLTVILLQN